MNWNKQYDAVENVWLVYNSEQTVTFYFDTEFLANLCVLVLGQCII